MPVNVAMNISQQTRCVQFLLDQWISEVFSLLWVGNHSKLQVKKKQFFCESLLFHSLLCIICQSWCTSVGTPMPPSDLIKLQPQSGGYDLNQAT